jgi:apolipoprotein N-acyltransferase
LAFLASAAMLTVIQPPIDLSVLAWISLVPFILACSPNTKPKSLALVAYIVSLCYWMGNLYWVAPITVLGWLVFCLYTAVLWPLVAFSLRYCRAKKIPLFLAAGVLFVGAERLQGFFLGGFFWRFLAHSQYQNITLIQSADIFGTAGLSFLVAIVNGLLAELILDARQKHIFKISNLVKTVIVCAAVVAAIIYGQWRINQSPQFITQGPLVASLQSNVPQSVKRTFAESDKMFDDLMQQSRAAAQSGAELIVWPETMVQAVLNSRVVAILEPSHPYCVFDKALRELSKDTAYVLVGAYGGTPQISEDSMIHLAERFNSAFLYKSDGRQSDDHYDKIHLVPFGEFLPFKKKIHALYNLLMKFTPYNYDYSLDAGSEYTVFEMASGDSNESQPYRFGVMICYEDTLPKIARRFVIDQKGQNRADWLINISNDGWFVRFKDDKVIPSTELPQHAAICVFRAVENRVSVLRSVNTGISCLIDSLGRIRNGYVAASQDFPAEVMQREGIAGWFTDKMPIDTRVTFFSKYGQWLDFCCAVCFVLLIIIQLLAKFLKSKKTCLSERTNEKLNNKS